MMGGGLAFPSRAHMEALDTGESTCASAAFHGAQQRRANLQIQEERMAQVRRPSSSLFFLFFNVLKREVLVLSASH